MTENDTRMIIAKGLGKTFTLHNQGGVTIDVFDGLELEVSRGGCLILTGPSGAGKSSLLRSLYGNYKAQTGSIHIRHRDAWIDLCAAEPFEVLEMRRETMGYVSQFLRVIPRVPTIDLVTEPLIVRGEETEAARQKAAVLLTRLRIPEELWGLPPATFSGGEQQRVNIAMTFVQDYPVLLLDEPTASLDLDNRRTVIELIREARERGAAIVGIFHDAEVRGAVGTHEFPMERPRSAA